MTKLWLQEIKKEAARVKAAMEAKEATLKRAEDAKKVVIKLDTSLPEAIK